MLRELENQGLWFIVAGDLESPRPSDDQPPPSPDVTERAAKAAPESIRGAHHQSMDPVRSTRATVLCRR